MLKDQIKYMEEKLSELNILQQDFNNAKEKMVGFQNELTRQEQES